ncbi:MAG TPA: DUF2158 domain-containing protein [bacterium]|nr:DUF2158 domain-containing protein [bacterium]
MEPFKKGDVVRLKSGGVTMTVERILDGGTRAVCAWTAPPDDESISAMDERTYPVADLVRVPAPTVTCPQCGHSFSPP